MVTTLTRSQPAIRPDKDGLRLEPRSIRRRPILALSSALLVAVCVATFTSLYLRAGHEVSVLAIARPVSQGQILTDQDLSVVRISMSSGVTAVSANSAATVVGRRVSVPLEPGALLVPADVTTAPSLPAGYAIVGVVLKSGQLPASGVVPGEAVDVVMTGAPGTPYSGSSGSGDQSSGQSEPGGVSGPGTILAPEVSVTDVAVSPASSGSDTVVVSLEVPRTLAPVIASASAAGQAALVVVTPES